MSICWYIYRARAEAGPITTWEADNSEPVAQVESVKTRLSKLFPTLKWSVRSLQVAGSAQMSHSGLALNEPGDEYVDLSLSVDDAGYVRMIVARKASPTVVISIMEEFALDNVYQDQPGVMVDPYAFEGNWQPKR